MFIKYFFDLDLLTASVFFFTISIIICLIGSLLLLANKFFRLNDKVFRFFFFRLFLPHYRIMFYYLLHDHNLSFQISAISFLLALNIIEDFCKNPPKPNETVFTKQGITLYKADFMFGLQLFLSLIGILFLFIGLVEKFYNINPPK